MFGRRRTPAQPDPLARDIANARRQVRNLDRILQDADARVTTEQLRLDVDARNAYAAFLNRHGVKTPPLPAIRW